MSFRPASWDRASPRRRGAASVRRPGSAATRACCRHSVACCLSPGASSFGLVRCRSTDATSPSTFCEVASLKSIRTDDHSSLCMSWAMGRARSASCEAWVATATSTSALHAEAARSSARSSRGSARPCSRNAVISCPCLLPPGASIGSSSAAGPRLAASFRSCSRAQPSSSFSRFSCSDSSVIWPQTAYGRENSSGSHFCRTGSVFLWKRQTTWCAKQVISTSSAWLQPLHRRGSSVSRGPRNCSPMTSTIRRQCRSAARHRSSVRTPWLTNLSRVRATMVSASSQSGMTHTCLTSKALVTVAMASMLRAAQLA
mmetsp:Transcript_1189/g.3084  ORF Transcript_1189/g.3084 Transcript_1189/m.3084 type:complete len:314 (+) Transcript_1189:259-1200(+)